MDSETRLLPAWAFRTADTGCGLCMHGRFTFGLRNAPVCACSIYRYCPAVQLAALWSLTIPRLSIMHGRPCSFMHNSNDKDLCFSELQMLQ